VRSLPLLAALLLLCGTAGAAPTTIETFELLHRTAEEVIPVLRPLVPEPGVVTGMGDRVIVRGTREVLDSVAEALGHLDRPPRRLLVKVRQERAGNVEALGATVDTRGRAGELTLSTGRGGSGAGVETSRGRTEPGAAGSWAAVRVLGTSSRDEGAVEQQVQTLEGRAALIKAGQSFPVGERYVLAGPGGATTAESVRYVEATSGFWVLPRVSGDQVTLEITPFGVRPASSGGGVVDLHRADAVVSGPLGEWLLVASSAQTSVYGGAGTAYSTRSRGELGRLLLIKVEELPQGPGR
jgi:hypothetical protein